MDMGAIARGLTAQAAPVANEQNEAKPGEIRKAVRDFEALWIETMLHSARPSADATLTGESDSTRDMVLDMADQQIAQMLAASGGFGLARIIGQGLQADAASPALEPTAASVPPADAETR